MANRFASAPGRRPLPLALFLGLLACSGCAVNPVTGERELSLVSTAEEIAMGEQQFFQFQQVGGGLYTADPGVAKYVAEIGRRVAAVSDRPLPYEFVVLNTNTPNAWALPGGKIAITRGLLMEMENEAELAAILGHEIVHAAARHGARSMQSDMLSRYILAGLTIATHSSPYTDLIVAGGDVGLQLVNLKYGRDDEREADYYGMKYMRAAGYDTAAAVSLQQKFVAIFKAQESGWLAGLFATHPPSTERVENTRAALAKFPPGGTLGRAAYAKRLAHLRARKDAYEDANRAGELLQQDPAAALQAIGDAIAREPKEASFYGIRGWILAREGRSADAVRAFDAAIRRDGGYYAHYLGRGMAHADLGNRRKAQDDVLRSYKLLPTAAASYELGRIALADGDREYAKGWFRAAAGAGGNSGTLAHEAYIRLDIVDAPENYVAATPFLWEGELLVRVTNSTGLELRDIEIRVDATVYGVPQFPITSRIRRLPANGYNDAGTRIYYGSPDDVRATARVVRARPAS